VSAQSQVPELSKLPATGDRVGGKYRVEGTAGVGGMGVVLCARHEELGNQVAIKFLASEDDTSSGAVERFLREGKIVASLQSDHVVRIYDVGRLDSGIPYMVMELLRGQDLGDYIAASGAVPVQQAVDWILQASHAISEAHERGIIHRDLKPSNLFLTQRSDGADCVKVLDFGISKRIEVQDSEQFGPSLTATRQIVGSPAYMSPEQVRNARDIDHRVDIWALGMTLYELLAGRTAFDADTFPAVCAAIVADSPPSLRELVPDIPQGLESTVMRCLEKDPAKRFASVSALANSLRQFASPVSQSASRSRASLGSLSGASGPNPSTLISSTPDPMASNRRAHSPSSPELFRDRTMNSADVESISVSQQRVKGGAPRSMSRLALPLLALVGFAAVAIWKGTRHPASRDIAPNGGATAAIAVKSDQFVVHIESVPSDAEVWDGAQLLGRTPFNWSLDHADVRAATKKLTIRKDAFEPYIVLQGDAPQDVTISAKLIRHQEPETTPAPQPPKWQQKSPGPRKPASVSTTAAQPDGNDIRSTR
jgi:eukaryotic-like serine/threonine-protein kinase